MVDLDVLAAVRDEVMSSLAGVFGRRESRERAGGYLRGLLSDVPRKNGWTIAEHAGYARPDGIQRLLYKDKWDELDVRDRVRDLVVDNLRDPEAVLVFDETGQEKSGIMTAGVGRQYTGTAGKITNAIVAVYCTYATSRGHCLIDGDLYVQKAWFTDPERCTQAGFDPDHVFRTKPELALEQAKRILAAGVTVRWATADEVYGRNGVFRRFFETNDIGYVMAVGLDFHIATRTGPKRADLIARTLPPNAFNRRSCGQGARGLRVYDWAMVATSSPRHALLIRRSITNPDDIAYFYTFTPAGEPILLSTLIRITGIRWTVEEDFQQSKGQAGLDQTQARRYRSWRRHIILAITALAIQAIGISRHNRQQPDPVLPTHGDDTPPDDYGMIALTVPEAHRLLILHDSLRDLPATTARHHTEFRLAWTTWRRRHQARTRWFHHRKRLAILQW
jgi:SRSO17 transposase